MSILKISSRFWFEKAMQSTKPTESSPPQIELGTFTNIKSTGGLKSKYVRWRILAKSKYDLSPGPPAKTAARLIFPPNGSGAAKRACSRGFSELDLSQSVCFFVVAILIFLIPGGKRRQQCRRLLRPLHQPTTCHGWRSTGPTRSPTSWATKTPCLGSRSSPATATCPTSS